MIGNANMRTSGSSPPGWSCRNNRDASLCHTSSPLIAKTPKDARCLTTLPKA